MSSIPPLSISQPGSLRLPTCSDAQSIDSIDSSTEFRENILSTPIHTPLHSTSFEQDNKFSSVELDELVARLADQRSKLLHFYDREMQLCQPNTRLNSFLNRIDQLFEEFDQQPTNTVKGRSKERFHFVCPTT